VGWGLLLTAAAVFHDTHVLILAMLLSIGLIVAVLSRSLGNWRGLVVIGAVLVVAGLAQGLFTMAVERVVGAAPLRPPFLMARLIADGPGYRYLQRSCPQNGLLACRYLDRLPVTADEFLWGAGPHAVFAVVAPEERRALEREQLRFAWAVLRTDPWGVLSASTRNVLFQLRDFGLQEFNYGEITRVSLALKLPEHPWQRMQQTPAYHEQMPTRWFVSLEVLTSALALGFIAWALLARHRRSQASRIVLRTTVLIIGGVIVNCILCATISGPYPRFLERAVWLIPFAALLLLFAMRDTRSFRINGLSGNAHGLAPAEVAGAQRTESRCLTLPLLLHYKRASVVVPERLHGFICAYGSGNDPTPGGDYRAHRLRGGAGPGCRAAISRTCRSGISPLRGAGWRRRAQARGHHQRT